MRIVDIGSGQDPHLGKLFADIELEVIFADKESTNPNVVRQDMERLTYADESIEVIHCRNALDHTMDAAVAVKEMMRVVKPGGLVYIHCNLDQRSMKGHHYWDAKPDGKLTNPTGEVDLRELGFEIKYIENDPKDSHRNEIIATWRKP